MAITQADAPFTYTGSWDITAYGTGEFYARLLGSGTFTPKRNITIDLFLVGHGFNGGAYVWDAGGGQPGASGAGGRCNLISAYEASTGVSVNVTIPTVPSSGSMDANFGEYSSGGMGSVAGGYSSPLYHLAFWGDRAPFDTMRLSIVGAGGNSPSYNLGGSRSGENGAPNTGNGGGGANVAYPESYRSGGAGGSGVIIIRGVLNAPPQVPTSITIPTTINGGVQFAISWGSSTDTDGNLSGYKLERSLNGGTWTQIFQANALTTNDTVAFGTNTVAYRVKAYDSDGAESDYQTSPTRTVVNNQPPTVPSNITVPANVIGGSSITVSWGSSTDTDGNLTGYRLSRSINGAEFAQIYQGTNLFYADSITKGWNTVAYRVKAYDANGAESGYATSPTRTVDNASPPEIDSSTSDDIGVKNDGFTWTYTVTQPDSEATTVVETMDGVAIRNYTAVLGEENTFDVTGVYFQSILNGFHTMQVTATTGGKSASHTVTFTKAVYALSITLENPLPADGPITKMVMNVTQSIPGDAAFQVLATNNANDPSPVWEDVTLSVLNGLNYLFSNTTLINLPAFNFKITASRGISNLGGFISAIGGAFE